MNKSCKLSNPPFNGISCSPCHCEQHNPWEWLKLSNSLFREIESPQCAKLSEEAFRVLLAGHRQAAVWRWLVGSSDNRCCHRYHYHSRLSVRYYLLSTSPLLRLDFVASEARFKFTHCPSPRMLSVFTAGSCHYWYISGQSYQLVLI